jgi:predicted nucleic acid-binding Zn ribbon protein
MPFSPDPQPLASAVSRLIQERGLARQRANMALQGAWKQVAGDRIAAASRVQGVRRGVLQVTVDNAPLLSELQAFRKPALLKQLQTDHPEWRLKEIRFRLSGR